MNDCDDISTKTLNRMGIIKKYKGKNCDLVSHLNCSVNTCSLLKCPRVQELTGVRSPADYYIGRSMVSVQNDSNPAAIVDRVMKIRSQKKKR